MQREEEEEEEEGRGGEGRKGWVGLGVVIDVLRSIDLYIIIKGNV